MGSDSLFREKLRHLLFFFFVGSGVNAEVIRQLMEEIHASSFHMSGKKIISSGMIFRNQQIHMGLPGFGEFDVFRTDKEQIQRARQTLDKIQV